MDVVPCFCGQLGSRFPHFLHNGIRVHGLRLLFCAEEFFRTIGINNDFHLDPTFTLSILLGFAHTVLTLPHEPNARRQWCVKPGRRPCRQTCAVASLRRIVTASVYASFESQQGPCSSILFQIRPSSGVRMPCSTFSKKYRSCPLF